MSDLDFRPPTEEIPDSGFGGYAEGVQPVKCIEYRLQENGRCAWVEFEVTEGQYKGSGKISMNLFLPTKDALNEKAKEKGSKEEALKSFFHYGQTCKAMAIAKGSTIKEALDAMVGWTGKALFENRINPSTNEPYGTSVKKVIGAGEAEPGVPAAPPSGNSDAPF